MGCCNYSPKGLESQKSNFTRITRSGTFVLYSRKKYHEEYQFVRSLGDGSYGNVNLVCHKATGLERAVKEIDFKTDENYELAVEEVEIMKQMDHPNIIHAFEIFKEAQKLQIVMELCTGGELFDRIIKEQSFSERIAAKYMLDLISALNYMHSLGIVHRDLKPENLLFENDLPDARLKLVDFGGATRFTPGKKLRYKVGSFYYIAPEILEGSYDEKVDVWSAGIIMYILICGRPPFNGKTDNEIYKKILYDKVTFSEKNWRFVSNHAKDMISAMLEKNPVIRPSISEVLMFPWLQDLPNLPTLDDPIAIDSLMKLNAFNVNCKLQRATLGFISSQLLAQDELKELKDLFDSLDSNRDGKLSKREIEEGYQRFGVDLGVQMDMLMDKCDIDGSGYVDYNEFIIATVDWPRTMSQMKLFEAFKLFDLDGDGKVSLQEIFNLLGEEGESETSFMEILKETDTNEDGFIDFSEFSSYMMKKLVDPPQQLKK